MPLDVLAIMAHPDDAELLCGGALAKAAGRGERVGVLDLTRGESGSQGSAELRYQEATRAAEVLGLTVRRNAGLPDSALTNDQEARQTLVALIRELKPRVVVTHWTNGRHPAHRVPAELVYDASFLAALRNYDAPGTPHRPEKVVHCLLFREDAPPPTFVVDISEHIDAKLAALACFKSQLEGKSAAGEAFAGGDRPLLDQVRVHCARSGSLIRRAYGESFWTRETWELASLGAGVGVSTF
ncbi:MAG: bacillithiol biosynthesis deacetylase BshB1 [Candidatus Hydrogenedentes bacterium]|nr:bacillithiol biosynthesis deacetylase BshB1 [Candidatus Hydrogenedentota bacterium]